MCQNIRGILMVLAFTSYVSASVMTFSMMARPHGETCFTEIFPDKESIAIEFYIEENYYTDDPHKNKQKDDIPTYVGNNPIRHLFRTDNGQILAKIDSTDDHIFTHTTLKRDVITVCADNISEKSLLIHYNITSNVANNDHERVPDKDHLRLYEKDLENIEELTEAMATENSLVLEKTRSRYFSSDKIPSSASKFAGIALAAIVIVKFLQVLYLRNRLRVKKLI